MVIECGPNDRDKYCGNCIYGYTNGFRHVDKESCTMIEQYMYINNLYPGATCDKFKEKPQNIYDELHNMSDHGDFCERGSIEKMNEKIPYNCPECYGVRPFYPFSVIKLVVDSVNETESKK